MGEPLTPEKIARAVPRCPRCKLPLIARRHDRRFIEDDHYVECIQGHVWHLSEGDEDG
jgi:hypothetical protein